MNYETWKRWTTSAALVAMGIAGGSLFQSSNTALGEVRSGPPPVAFQSGGQMSVPILKEIAATLNQMDGRLERLEGIAKRMQSPSATGRFSVE